MTAKLRMAMVGGGPGSFVGPVHHLGSHLSGRVELVAGVFSSNMERGKEAAEIYGIAPDRVYATHDDLFAVEREREDGIDLVALATPNHLHFAAAMAAIGSGVHIMSEKPATAQLAEVLALREALSTSRTHYALCFSYTGYPMVREARARVADGSIGRVRKVLVIYSQGWLSTALEKSGHSGATWRADASKSGIGGCSADIGIHAFNLVEFVTGEKVVEISADLHTLVPSRELDDDANVLLHLAGGGAGVLAASQVAFGEENGLSIQVYGDAGALHWAYAQAGVLKVVRADGGVEMLCPMSPGLRTHAFLPPNGTGEGLIAAFAVLYHDFAKAISGDESIIDHLLPGIEAGVRSMRFVERAVASSRTRGGWTALG